MCWLPMRCSIIPSGNINKIGSLSRARILRGPINLGPLATLTIDQTAAVSCLLAEG